MREEIVDAIIDRIKEREKRFHEYYLSSTYEKTVSPRELYSYIESEIRSIRHILESARE